MFMFLLHATRGDHKPQSRADPMICMLHRPKSTQACLNARKAPSLITVIAPDGLTLGRCPVLFSDISLSAEMKVQCFNTERIKCITGESKKFVGNYAVNESKSCAGFWLLWFAAACLFNSRLSASHDEQLSNRDPTKQAAGRKDSK